MVQQRKKFQKKRSLFQRIGLNIRSWFRKVMLLRSDPHQIALGFAVGAFIGIFPSLGLGILIITLLGIVIKYNVPAGILGSAIANPFLAPFWLFVSCQTGSFILRPLKLGKDPIQTHQTWIQKITHIGLDCLVGYLVISTVISVLCYFLVKRMVIIYRLRKEARRNHYSLGPSPKGRK